MIDEKISAFLDGEASREDVLDILERVKREPALRALLDRQLRVRAVIRGEAPRSLDVSFADRVMGQIQAEERRDHAKVVAPRQWRPSMRGVAGLAMAASVAAVAILATNTFNSLDTVSSVFLTARNDTPAGQNSAELQLTAPIENIATRWEELPQDDARELNGYLISHNNSATDHGVGGSIGFMRVTTSNTDELQTADR
jgi:negative regulator of sigma E activity